MKKKLLLILLFIICNLSAQIEHYSLKNIATNEGLSQSSVITIHQDTLGQIWMGTRDGLNKYDGTRFTVFRTDPYNQNTISNNDILAIEEDKNAKLWIGTYNGLNYYDPVDNIFKRFFHSKKNNSICNNTIWCVKEIKNEIWIGTSKGLSIYNKKTEKFITLFRTNKNCLPSNNILSILPGRGNEIWVGTSKGLAKLFYRKGNDFRFENITKSTTLNQLFVQCIIKDSFNNIWIGTKNSGIAKYNPKTKIIQFLANTTPFKKLNQDIRALTFDKKGQLWIGAYDGIFVVDKQNTIHQIKNNNKNDPIDKIKSLCIDKKGSVWVGTYYKGVNFWDISNGNFINFNQNSSNKNISFDVVSAITTDRNKNIYLGTEGAGITVFDAKTNNSRFLDTPHKEKNDIKSLRFDLNGVLWIGTFTKGITAYNVTNNSFCEELISFELNKYLDQTGVYDIKIVDKSSLWLGTFGKGLVKYNTNNGSFITIDTNTKPNALTNNRIRCILTDTKQNLWVGTQNGLNHIVFLNPEKNKFSIKHYFFNNSLLDGDDILTLFLDHKKKLWVGTKAKGLYYFNGLSFDKIKLIINNKPITLIHAILQDNKNNLWMSSNQGILKYNFVNNKLNVYNQKDGLIGNEFNDNACLQINKDQYYFGGPFGVTYFDIHQLAQNTYSPQVLISKLNIQNQDKDGNLFITEQNITYKNGLTLHYNQANFSIEFSIPNFVKSKKNKYKYRLKGLVNSWNTTTQSEITYNIQKPGNYTFEIYGANNDGVWNLKPSVFEITINPAPWRSSWAIAVYIIIIVLIVYGINWILRSKEKLKKELEIEYIQAQIIKENNQAKLEFFTNISHEFRTPLTLILGPLQQILLKYNGSNEMYKKLLVIESSANNLLNLINRLMDFRKLENKQFPLQAAEGNIVKFIKEIFFTFIEYAKQGDYTYTLETTAEEILVFYDRPKLEQVLYNLISNAFKYTPKGGKIVLKIYTDPSNINIAVEDTGVGIATANIDKIFDLFFEIPSNNIEQENHNKGTGIGLSIVKSIVELHKGHIEVKNKPTTGVIFKLNLPLGKNHLSEAELIQEYKTSNYISQYHLKPLEKELVIEEVDLANLIPVEDQKTILIVEDHNVLRNFMKNLLQKEYNILEAKNGKIALNMAIDNNPDLIISDVIMPEMVGTELCARIKKDITTSHIPVILLTSRTDLIYKFEGLESGADDYISKPFNLVEFKLRIKNILESTDRMKAKFSKETTLRPSEIVISSLDEELFKKAFKIVEDNISNEQLDIPFFCSQLGVSRTMLFSKIKAWTNFTPNEFIHEIRLKRAAQLLEQNKINVSQISYKVGFNNPKYFSKCFQKKFGDTPTQYAEKFFKQL